MGFDLDNIGIEGQEQFMFMPSDGSIVFDPSNEKIKTYSGNHPNAIVVSSRDVSEHELYFNKISKRAYTWSGSVMVEADLTVPETTTLPTCDTDFSQDNTEYHITDIIVVSEMSNRVIGDNVTLVFHEGGRLVGGTLEGKYSNPETFCNVKVIPNGEQIIFDGCSFTGCRIVDSELFATNFGAIADMHNVNVDSLEIKNLTLSNLNIRQGTNNTDAFLKIGQFLSNSVNLHLVLNGSFYSSSNNGNQHHIHVNKATGLEIVGRMDCEMTLGINLIDCNEVNVHHIGFVGFHSLHAFPTIYVGKADINQANWEQQQSANPFLQNYTSFTEFNEKTFDSSSGESLSSIGLADSAILVSRSPSGADCGDIRIHDCHFEMRQGGVCARSHYDTSTSELRPLRHVHVHDCTFDHIYFQAVESYCEYALFEHIDANYCLQGLDISTYGNHTVVRDCRFTHCAKGSKQESAYGLEDHSHHNVIENCYFQIDDTMPYHNIPKFAFQVHKGLEGDTFVMRDCEIDINVAQRYTGLICRSWSALFERVSFRFATTEPKPNNLSDIEMLISAHASNSHECLARFVGCNFEIDCSAYDFYNLSSFHMRLSLEDTVITGTGSIKNTIANRCKHLMMRGCTVDITYQTIAYDCNVVELSSCVFGPASGAAFQMPDTTAQPHEMTVRADRCSFSSTGNLVFLKTSGGSYSFTSCNIMARSVMQRLPSNVYQPIGLSSLVVSECTIRISSSKVVDGFALSEINQMFFSNNVLSSTISSLVSASSNNSLIAASPKDAAHVFYNNFLCRSIAPVNEGNPDDDLPEYPWVGMVYYDTTEDQLIFRSVNTWTDTPPSN